MWPLKIAWDALRGILGSVGGYLSLAGIAAALLGAVYFSGVQNGKSDARREFEAARYEARIAALKEERRREAALAKRLEREKSELQKALEQIDDESPITGDGADVRLGPDFLCQLRRTYDPDIGCGAAISLPDKRVH